MWLVSAQSVANEIDNAEEVRARLYVRGQALIREVNEQIHRLDPEWSSEGGRCSIICECVNSECLATIQLPSQVYAAVRRFPTRFVLAPEHVADAFLLEAADQELGTGHGRDLPPGRAAQPRSIIAAPWLFC